MANDHVRDSGHEHHHDESRLASVIHRLLHRHGHDPAESIDSALESSDQGIRAVKISLGILGVTAALQAVVVVLSGSVALLGDALHNGADALTAVPLWVAFTLARRRPSRRYTYGYGRAEDLAGIAVIVTIAASAAVTGIEAVRRLFAPQPIDYLGWVALAGVVGFVGNELTARYRIRTGRRIGSAALVADGIHARTDGFTSLAVVAGCAGVALGWDYADPVAGLVITAAIVVVCRDAARGVYYRLMDAVDPELVDRANRVIASTPGVEGLDSLRLRWNGHRLHAEAEINVDANLSLVDAHEIANQAHHALLHGVPRLDSVIVHASPSGGDGIDYHEPIAHHADGREHRHED